MPGTFSLLAGHPVVDFVNTLDGRFAESGPVELLLDYADLLAFVQQGGLFDPSRAYSKRIRPAAAKRALRSALELREALAVVLYGALISTAEPPPRALKTLENHFRIAFEHREFTWQRTAGTRESHRGAWKWGRFWKSAEVPVWALALSSASLLTSDSMKHLKACSSATCQWLFLDLSKNQSRRWCDMKICGNRTKARRFQARHSA